MQTSNELSPLLVRMPADLKQWLKAAAKSERRTMTGQLLHMLEQAKEAKQTVDANGIA